MWGLNGWSSIYYRACSYWVQNFYDIMKDLTYWLNALVSLHVPSHSFRQIEVFWLAKTAFLSLSERKTTITPQMLVYYCVTLSLTSQCSTEALSMLLRWALYCYKFPMKHTMHHWEAYSVLYWIKDLSIKPD